MVETPGDEATALSAGDQYLLQAMLAPSVCCILSPTAHLSKIWMVAGLEANVTNPKCLNIAVVLEERKKGLKSGAGDVTWVHWATEVQPSLAGAAAEDLKGGCLFLME